MLFKEKLISIRIPVLYGIMDVFYGTMQVPIIGIGEVPIETIRRLEGMLNTEFSKIKIYAKGNVAFPEDTFNDFRDQYVADRLMDEFHKDGIQILLTEEDIYSKGKNYVFGESEYMGPALVSTHRLDPQFYGEEKDEGLLFRRLKKEALHEFGHCFGLDHCENPECVMQYSGSVKAVDEKSSMFCDECQVEISTKGLPLK